MAIERILPFVVIVDRISTRFGFETPTTYGRYDIHPRGGDLVNIVTPQDTILTVGERDVVHVKAERGKSKVVQRFDTASLPVGFSRTKHSF